MLKTKRQTRLPRVFTVTTADILNFTGSGFLLGFSLAILVGTFK